MTTIHSSAAKRPTLSTLPTARSLRARSERPGILVALNRFAVRCRSAVCADQTQSHPRSGCPGILVTMPRAALAALLMAFALTALAPTNAVAQQASLTVTALANATTFENTTYTSAQPDTPTFMNVTPTNPSFTWSLGGDDEDDFGIDSATGVVTLSPRDFEMPDDSGTNNTYQFTLIAIANFSDGDGNLMMLVGTSAVTTITITDVMETATFTVTDLADASIAENTTYTSTTPATTGDTPIGALTWTLGGGDAAQFTIDAATGIVTLDPLDFEALMNDYDYAFTVTATDEDDNRAASTVTTITITDVGFTVPALADVTIDENMTYTSTLPSITGTHCEVPPLEEGVPTNTLISGLTFTWTLGGEDADALGIVGDATTSAFSIDTSTGRVTLSPRDLEAPTDSDMNNTYLFTVTATATTAADCAATSPPTTITIDDVNEALAYTGTFTETAANDGTVEGSITATLTGDTFHADVVGSGYVTASNVPAGLTAVFTRDSDGVVTLTLTGTTTAHEDANDVTDLTITFADAAFAAETAATVAGSTYATGMIDFNDTDTPMHNLEKLNEQILSRTSQSMTASVSARVIARVEAAGNGNDGTGDSSALAYQFGGYSSMHDLLQSHGKAMLGGEMEVAQLLDGASFVLPLSAAGDEGGGKLGALSLWGGGNLTQMDGDSDNLDWDGDMSSFHLGVDAPVGNNMLAGLALSLNTANFDYNDDGESGDYEYNTTNLHPYFGYQHNEKLKLWGAAGLGEGEIEVDGDNGISRSTDTTQTSLAGGFSNRIVRSGGLLPDSVTTLTVKSDASFVQVDVDKDEGLDSQNIDSHHLRLLVSGEQRSKLASGGSLAPSAEIGVRYDGGDGVTGAGVEVGTGLHYAHPGAKLTVAGNLRGLLLDEYDEWSADFTVRLAPQSGRGLSLSLQPVWGDTQSTTEQLWDGGAGEFGDNDAALQSRMNSEVGYSVAAKMLGSAGLLTPYTGLTTADGGVSHVRLGSRFAGGGGLSLNLEGARENDGDGASNTVLLRGELEF